MCVSLLPHLSSFLDLFCVRRFARCAAGQQRCGRKVQQGVKPPSGLKALEGFKSGLKTQDLAAARASPSPFALEDGKMLPSFSLLIAGVGL